MSKETEQTIHPEIQEKMILARYAGQKEIPFDELIDSIQIDPFEIHYDDLFESRKDQDYYSTITGLYGSIPRDHVSDEGIEFNARLWGHKKKFLNVPDVINDVEGSDILRSMNPDSMSFFAAWTHGLILDKAIDEFNNGRLTDKTATRLIFWSQMHRITTEASELLKDSEQSLDMV